MVSIYYGVLLPLMDVWGYVNGLQTQPPKDLHNWFYYHLYRKRITHHKVSTILSPNQWEILQSFDFRVWDDDLVIGVCRASLGFWLCDVDFGVTASQIKHELSTLPRWCSALSSLVWEYFEDEEITILPLDAAKKRFQEKKNQGDDGLKTLLRNSRSIFVQDAW